MEKHNSNVCAIASLSPALTTLKNFIINPPTEASIAVARALKPVLKYITKVEESIQGYNDLCSAITTPPQQQQSNTATALPSSDKENDPSSAVNTASSPSTEPQSREHLISAVNAATCHLILPLINDLVRLHASVQNVDGGRKAPKNMTAANKKALKTELLMLGWEREKGAWMLAFEGVWTGLGGRVEELRVDVGA